MSKQALLKLSTDFSFPAIDYAGQGNAIIGIRDAGKTYTAMKAAEESMDNEIPIVCYDPVGIWKNLKVGVGKHKGYPIVVAGGQGSDIRLTATNAVDIIRAAMKENVSLIFDLYSPELINKSTWIRIVQETVDVLMYENKDYGMRHIFLEEAAEFIPQRIQPQQSRVYASLERLARMGRNARLGMTIINQRAEEVNKAILEICAFSLLHKQVGKNSLKSIQQWLELRQLTNVPEIIKSLPGLKQGQCWAIGQTEHPQLIQITARKTFHPDPKIAANVDTQKASVDVTAFVDRMNKHLAKPVPAAVAGKEPAKGCVVDSSLRKENDRLRKQADDYSRQIEQYKQMERHHQEKIRDAIAMLRQSITVSKDLPRQSVAAPSIDTRARSAASTATANTHGGGTMRMLKAAAMFYPKSISVQRMAALAGMSAKSGTFGVYFRSLKRDGLISVNGKQVTATEKGLVSAGDIEPLSSDPKSLLQMWISNVGEDSGMAKILRVLFQEHPQALSSHELGISTGLSPTSGTFGVYQRKLRALGLIKMDGGGFRLADEFFE